MIHIWHEDSNDSVTQKFWEFLREQKVLGHLGRVEIRAFEHNYELVNHLVSCSFTDTDTYFIFLDYVLDNDMIVEYIDTILSVQALHSNLIFVPLLCFEYLLLRSPLIVDWLTCTKLNIGFNRALEARQAFLAYMSGQSDKKLLETDTLASYLCTCYNLSDKKELKGKFITTETVATLILHNLTNSLPTDFVVTKTKWGSCWTCNCCRYRNRQGLCSLYTKLLNSQQKAKDLYTRTDAKLYLEGK